MIDTSQSPYADAFQGCTVLVTGGAGFIGSHLTRSLLALGATVRVLDDLSYGHAKNVPAEAAFTHASILDDDALRDAMEDCDFVFHLAAMMSVPMSVEQPLLCVEINIHGTVRVLEAAKDFGVKRLVFAASSAAYGETEQFPSREDQPTDCCSPYAASKVSGELLLTAFSHCYTLSTVSLRYFNVFGPRQDPQSAYAAVISAFADALVNDRRPTIFGTGRQTRDFVYVDNVIHANLLAGACEKPLVGEVVNVGSGSRVSLLEILDLMGRHLGVEVDPVFDEPRAGDVMHSLADISRTKQLIGYEPVVPFEDGLKQTLDWMNSQSG